MTPTTIDPSVITQFINALPLSVSVKDALVNIVAVGSAVFVGVQAMLSRMPVANADSPTWYKNLYGVLARYSLNVGKNSPIPADGAAPALGLVPVHPVQQPSPTGTKLVETAPVK